MKSSFRMSLILIGVGIALTYTTNGQTNTFPSSGNVGIGTTGPMVALEVVGNGFFTNLSSSELSLNSSGINYASIYDPGIGGSNGGIALGGSSSVGGVPSAAVMFWNINNGDVGIGTTAPNAQLVVTNSSGSSGTSNIYTYIYGSTNSGLTFTDAGGTLAIAVIDILHWIGNIAPLVGYLVEVCVAHHIRNLRSAHWIYQLYLDLHL